MSERQVVEVERVSKQTQVFDLVVQGSSFREAADLLNISRSTASRYFKEVMGQLKVPDHKLQEWRILVSQRLDFTISPMLKALADHNSKKSVLSIRDLGDIARAIARVEDRRARMLGLDKPAKIDITHHIPSMDPEEAAKRQRDRLSGAKFPLIATDIPHEVIPKEANGNEGS